MPSILARMGNDAMLLKIWRGLAHWLHGIPDDEAAKCRYCSEPVEPHVGVRGSAGVFCSEDCSREHFTATTA